MKKMVIFLMFVLGSFLSASCTSLKIFDENIPEEKMAEVSFDHGLVPTSYNGIHVEKFSWTKLPEGTAEFVINLRGAYIGWNGNVQYDADDMVFSINLEGGKTYFITLWRQEGVFGVLVYDQILKFTFARTASHQIGFIPFEGQ
jgi:hypothetical protein